MSKECEILCCRRKDCKILEQEQFSPLILWMKGIKAQKG